MQVAATSQPLFIAGRFFAWLGGFGRLVVRYERHGFIHLGFLHLLAVVIRLPRLLQQALKKAGSGRAAFTRIAPAAGGPSACVFKRKST